MIESVYSSEPGTLIHCFAVAQRYIFFVKSSLTNTCQADLFYTDYEKNQAAIKSEYPIIVSRTSLKDDGTGYVVRSLQIVNVPLFRKGAPLECKFFLVINSGDGIQVCSLEDVITNSQFGEVHKWRHGKPQDSIHCSYSQGYKDGTIRIVYCTTAGSIIHMMFDVKSKCFKKLPLSKEVDRCQDRITDKVNNISGLRNTPFNYPMPSDEKLWTTQSNTEAMVFSCFDNNFYILVNNKLEVQSYYNLNEEATGDHILTWTDFAIVKQYSSSSLRFYVANISNVGCVVYKRSNRGNWDMVKLLPREINEQEKTSIVDCMIQLNSSNSNSFSVFCGSEDGRLYQWEYNYRDESIIESHIHQVEDAGVIHSLSIVGPKKKVFFLSKDNTSIKYLQLC